jgi:uncharacterized protein with GYD domain
MPKFLVEANYTAEGLRGLAKDKASGRKAAIDKALAALGGRLESVYYALGDTDVFVVCDFPDHVSAAALGLAVSATGMVRTRTTALLTIDEVDAALAKGVPYRAPGA